MSGHSSVELDRGEAVIRLMAAMVTAGRADYEQMAVDAVRGADALEAALAADAAPAPEPEGKATRGHGKRPHAEE